MRLPAPHPARRGFLHSDTTIYNGDINTNCDDLETLELGEVEYQRAALGCPNLGALSTAQTQGFSCSDELRFEYAPE